MLQNKVKKKSRDTVDTSGAKNSGVTSVKDVASGIIRTSGIPMDGTTHVGLFQPSAFYKDVNGTSTEGSKTKATTIGATHTLETTAVSSRKPWHPEMTNHKQGVNSAANEKTQSVSSSDQDMTLSQETGKSKASTKSEIVSPETQALVRYSKSYGEKEISPSYGDIPISTVFTCDICGKSFSKVASLEKHRKCHKNQIITFDPNLIKEGKVIIDGLNTNISPYIKLYKLDSAGILPRPVEITSHQEKYEEKRYINIRTYGSHSGTKDFRDTSGRNTSKKHSHTSQITPPLPGEFVLSQIRQELTPVSVQQGHNQISVSRSRSQEPHISIDLASPRAPRAGMKCTYASKANNKSNKYQLNTNTPETQTGLYVSDGFAIPGTGPLDGYKLGKKLDPLPKPIMSTLPIQSKRPMAPMKKTNVNNQNNTKSDKNSTVTSESSATGGQDSETLKKKDNEILKKKDNETLNKKTQNTKKPTEMVNGEISTGKTKPTADVRPKTTDRDTDTKELNQQDPIKKEKNAGDESQSGEKPKSKLTEEMKQLMKQTKAIDFREKHRYFRHSVFYISARFSVFQSFLKFYIQSFPN